MACGVRPAPFSIGADGRVGTAMLPAFCLMPTAARTWSSSPAVALFPSVNRRGLAGTAGRNRVGTKASSIMRVRR